MSARSVRVAIALLTPVLLGVLGFGWSPEGAATVSWMPDRPEQGQLFLVRVQPDAGSPPIAVTGTTAGEELRFERTIDGSYVSLAPMPVDADGMLEVRVTLEHSDGSEESLASSIPVSQGSFQHERLSVAPELGGPLSTERQARLDRDRAMAAEVSRQALGTPRLWSDVMTLPRDTRVTSGFGSGRIFNGEVTGRHLGLDLEGAPGEPVIAVASGVVALVEEFLLAGNIVYLNHGGGLLSGYFHLSEQLVEVGDTVEPGTVIGRVGATGRVTGPHLHWVVRYGSTSVDPRSLLSLVPDLSFAR